MYQAIPPHYHTHSKASPTKGKLTNKGYSPTYANLYAFQHPTNASENTYATTRPKFIERTQLIIITPACR